MFENFPQEINDYVFKLLDKQTLSSVSQTSKHAQVSSHRQLEGHRKKKQLMDDFFFSENNAEHLRNYLQMPDSEYGYQVCYDYCQEYQLTDYRKSAVEMYSYKNLTAAHLKGRYWFDKSYYISLGTLLEEKRLEVSDAINLLNQVHIFKQTYSLRTTQVEWLLMREPIEKVSKMSLKEDFEYAKEKFPHHFYSILEHLGYNKENVDNVLNNGNTPTFQVNDQRPLSLTLG